jgi:hypothetical protein
MKAREALKEYVEDHNGRIVFSAIAIDFRTTSAVALDLSAVRAAFRKEY